MTKDASGVVYFDGVCTFPLFYQRKLISRIAGLDRRQESPLAQTTCMSAYDYFISHLYYAHECLRYDVGCHGLEAWT